MGWFIYLLWQKRPRFKSVEMQSVTAIRVSKDYLPGNYQWDIGVSSIYTNALGLAPFKDVFWTTKDQPGNYHENIRFHF